MFKPPRKESNVLHHNFPQVATQKGNKNTSAQFCRILLFYLFGFAKSGFYVPICSHEIHWPLVGTTRFWPTTRPGLPVSARAARDEMLIISFVHPLKGILCMKNNGYYCTYPLVNFHITIEITIEMVDFHGFSH